MPRNQKIQLRTGSSVPAAADFDISEPAWDATNKRLYVKAADNTMVAVGFVIGRGTAAPSGGADGDIYLQYT